MLKPLSKAPYYAVQVLPTFTNTLGGPERNQNAEIMSRNGGTIPHLYGAGELGSILSHKYSGSGNISESLVFGRLAGANAAVVKSDVSQESVLGGKPGFRPDEIATLPNEAVANNGKIDNVSGASVTSNGSRTALADALSK